MTASELIKQLEKDKNYQDKLNEKTVEIQKKHDILVKESKCFSKDCSKFGYSLETAWDLIMIKDSYPDLIPLLMKYIEEKNHSAEFREGIARALAVKDSSPFFNRLLKLYYEAEKEPETVRWAFVCALSAAAITQEQLDVIENMIYDEKLGEDRIGLLDAIKKMKLVQKKRVIEYVSKDDKLSENLKILRIN